MQVSSPAATGRCSQTRASLRTTCHALIWLTIAIASLVLLGGWVCGVVALRNVVPGTVGMKAWTAIDLGRVGDLAAGADGAQDAAARIARRASAGFVALSCMNRASPGWRSRHAARNARASARRHL